jgi:2-polyprenyl-3-methyl-5-hydroxy-6-metoxy-1,4-benzoquinol methylase
MWNRIKASAISSGLMRPKVVADLAEWQRVHQEFEFEFHKGNQFRQSNAFVEETELLFSSFGFRRDQFVGKVIIDVGAGSRLRGKYFSGARLIALEPLADRFMREIPWSDLSDAAEVVSQPAEARVDSLVNSADFVFSINVLDHCFDFQRIMENIHSYLRETGTVFLSFDSHTHTSAGHPLVLTKKVCTDVFYRCGFTFVDFWRGFPEPFREYHGRNGYDGKSDSLSFLLMPARR